RGARPPIWRRLRVPGRFTLAQLHAVIQAAFGWEDYHLHVFDVDGSRYAPAGADLGARARDERKVRIAQVAPAVGDRLTYTYDFGDDWEHEIIVEQIVPADGPDQAVCVTGRRAAPPEDCGGVWGYAELCDILADPTHPEYTERREWPGREFDAAAFDPEPVNRVRGERPDVDAVYMTATQAMTGQGGWPMTVFATPDGEPFYCGTYFPRAQFVKLVRAVSDAWRDRREEVVRQGAAVVSALA